MGRLLLEILPHENERIEVPHVEIFEGESVILYDPRPWSFNAYFRSESDLVRAHTAYFHIDIDTLTGSRGARMDSVASRYPSQPFSGPMGYARKLSDLEEQQVEALRNFLGFSGTGIHGGMETASYQAKATAFFHELVLSRHEVAIVPCGGFDYESFKQIIRWRQANVLGMPPRSSVYIYYDAKMAKDYPGEAVFLKV